MVQLSILSIAILAWAQSTSSVSTGGHSGIQLFAPSLSTKNAFTVYSNPVKVDSPGASLVNSGSLSSNLKSKVAIATAYLTQKHNIPANTMSTTDAYTDETTGVTHVYLRQVIGGAPVANGLANVNIDSQGRVISSGQSFAPSNGKSLAKRHASSLIARASESATLRTAFKGLADYVKTPINDSDLGQVSIAASSGLVQGGSGYVISQVPDSVSSTATGKVEAINDWVASLESFNVYPRTINTPADGERSMMVDPANSVASPKGWVADSTTVGNNVWAQNNPDGGYTWKNNHRPSSSNGVFDFPLDLTKEPTTYVDAAITQLFYTVNTMHDLSYLYGFNEVAGNFQDVNYSGQGVGDDGVIANAQDGSGFDNANFATPPDGQRPRMRMYTWIDTSPNRDGDLEQDIVAHEFTHGISNRLTGGPSNTDCLGWGEPGGMGEGWSDAVALLLRIKPGQSRSADMLLGEYVYGKGIRNYPYSTSTTTNPNTYKILNDPNYQEVHAIGEVWAEMLYEVIWNLIDDNGMADDLFSHDVTKGNSIALQILLDGMKLQPCSPTFIDARNAIVQAEKNLTGGKNMCAVWKGFAKRGLGVNASGGNSAVYAEDYSVPSGC
ncbi:hypothetical protein FBU59_000827 [Linderina macrospora]|uniref:Uncharacterized protein n=1 Tax=Linderina macrospora TaxID=4868 RepID=A0ACC1JFP8_9FUNG|nr:hypothetical protein FBU59_000827 [Linderina macrospora]